MSKERFEKAAYALRDAMVENLMVKKAARALRDTLCEEMWSLNPFNDTHKSKIEECSGEFKIIEIIIEWYYGRERELAFIMLRKPINNHCHIVYGDPDVESAENEPTGAGTRG